MRVIATAFAAILAIAGPAQAQYSTSSPPNRTTTVPPSTVAPSKAPAMHADQFSSEADAKVHCPGGGTVVWLNTKSGVYHFAGSRDYGHTKQGAFMCRADADKVARAAKNEKAPAPR
jgi:hypothetical protein